MNVLLLGGTGAMGWHLVKLLEEDNKIFVTSRKPRQSSKNVTFLLGNAHDLRFIKQVLLLQKWDVIVDFMMYDITEFTSRKDLLLSSCKQYVSLSSARVYADCTLLSEDSPRLIDTITDRDYFNAHDYSLNKALMENELFKSEAHNYTIIRPYITYSENRLQLGCLEKEDWLYRVFNGHSLVISEDILEKKTTLTYGYDVARTIKALMGRQDALGHCFNPTQNESITWHEVLNIYLSVILKETGISPEVKLLKKDPALKTDQGRWQVIYDRLYDRVFDNRKLNSFIDTDTFLKPKDGLEKCLRAFLKDP